jgi:hypothetical protein
MGKERKVTQNGRPTVTAALRLVAGEVDDEGRDFKHVEIRLLQSGQVAYRLFPADGSDYVGGVALIG